MSHNPFNNPELAHPRARELMKEAFFWNCVNELAPFGSDEGAQAYETWREWRKDNPEKPLEQFIAWWLLGNTDKYSPCLYQDAQVELDLMNPTEALLSDYYDTFTLDASIIATGFGQLVDEGRIESDSKKYISVALNRQLHPKICTQPERREILQACLRVLESA